ncbi:hypothetical protein MCEGE10_02858 [Flavobacteriaceae bacterium]
MKTNFLIILSALTAQIIYGQNTVKMTAESGSKNKDVYDLMLFQDISVDLLTFESPEIKGKYYKINIEEYKNGKIVATKCLFEGNNSEYYKIDSTVTSFKFFSKTENNTLKTYLKGKNFGSRKVPFDLEKGYENYVSKNLLGNNKSINVPINGAFPILAIITATKYKEGTVSYSKVAQSEISPEKYWEEFKIPHYFIITMEFK